MPKKLPIFITRVLTRCEREYSYDTDEYKCYSDHFSDEIIENDFAYFIVENYEQSCRNVKEVLKRRE